jgi:hypothetical protein
MTEDEFNPIPLFLTAGAVVFLSASAVSMLIGLFEKPLGGSRSTEGGAVSSEAVREIMRELDPVDSLYFDISVARHSLEEADLTRAKRWLDANHALGELHRAIRLGFISPSEGDVLTREINEVVKLIEEGKLTEASRKIIDLQSKTCEIAYSAIAERFKQRGLDPPQVIDARFEPLREKKVAEWKAKGYAPGLIEKALLWAEEWSRGIARRFVKPPELAARVAETIYPEALELSQKWIEAMAI